ncbi:MAG: DUF72 domain-containing protein [Chitinivibrionales bacterium]|nr:DUF72 domain-containing protein [Chitinivibrionales bacterium]MBD3358660.1 DUF72 domain-containing protein [Chitinivibrionales bacterium]
MRIGTSGWSYPHWRGSFYPNDLPVDEWLGWYAERFDTVEINNSFYHLPNRVTFSSWRSQTPQGFIFSVKASRYITHLKKLRDAGNALTTLLSRAEGLQDKLGPILFQLPPRWRCNHQRLKDFLGSLPRDFSYAFEFRDPSWFNERTYALLDEYEAAHCLYHMGQDASPRRIAGPFAYVRLHGPQPYYTGDYDGRTLRGWARTMQNWSDEGREVYLYFDNDDAGYAALDAARIKDMLQDVAQAESG